jgi:diadenosine tetraphosphate (Ap4A) HIT family hydrolase
MDISQVLIREFNLEQQGYRLIINGGKYQTFPHLHVHLISGSTISPEEDTHSSS